MTNKNEEKGNPPEAPWNRVHPLTLLVETWHIVAAVTTYVVYQNLQYINNAVKGVQEGLQLSIARVMLIFAGIVIGALIVMIVLMYVSWRRKQWQIGVDSIVWRHGIIFRDERHLRYTRIQSVDIIHPLVGRIFGLGKLRIEAAGGANSKIEIGFLKDDVLQEIRAQVLARSAGVSLNHDTAYETDESQSGSLGNRNLESVKAQKIVSARAPQAPEYEIFRVGVDQLIGSLIRSIDVLVSGLVVIGALIAGIVVLYLKGASGLWIIIIGGSALVIPMVFGAGSIVFGRFNSGFGFRAATSPDGIRLSHGFTELQRNTIPPGRVHAVELRQPILWRRKDWWKVVVTIAGQESNGETSQRTSVLLPVGDGPQALKALWLVVRDLGVTDPDAALEAGMRGWRDDGGYTPVPRRARNLDLLSWRRNAQLITSSVVIQRSGRITRKLTVIPHERCQAVSLEQGPLERKLGLANVLLHLVPGEVDSRIHHMDAQVALKIWHEQRIRAQKRREQEPPEQWMRRVNNSEETGGTAPKQSEILADANIQTGE